MRVGARDLLGLPALNACKQRSDTCTVSEISQIPCQPTQYVMRRCEQEVPALAMSLDRWVSLQGDCTLFTGAADMAASPTSRHTRSQPSGDPAVTKGPAALLGQG